MARTRATEFAVQTPLNLASQTIEDVSGMGKPPVETRWMANRCVEKQREKHDERAVGSHRQSVAYHLTRIGLGPQACQSLEDVRFKLQYILNHDLFGFDAGSLRGPLVATFLSFIEDLLGYEPR